MGLAVVERIPSLIEAQIAVGALRSGGIDAEVFDANFGRVESPVIESLGGFRIMAPEAQAPEARELLRALRAGPGLEAPDEAGPWARSPRRRSLARASSARRVWTGVFLLAMAIWIVRALS